MAEIVKRTMLWTQVGVHHHISLLALAETQILHRFSVQKKKETQILHIAWHATDESRLTPWKAALKHVAP